MRGGGDLAERVFRRERGVPARNTPGVPKLLECTPIQSTRGGKGGREKTVGGSKCVWTYLNRSIRATKIEKVVFLR